MNTQSRRLILPGWLAGMLGATGTLITLGSVSMGWYVSIGGLVIAGVLALVVGTAAASIVEPAETARNSAVVAFYLVVLATAYFLIMPTLVELVPNGAPSVDTPRRGGPGVYPPR